jgi:hypothetical protein
MNVKDRTLVEICGEILENTVRTSPAKYWAPVEICDEILEIW